MGVDRGAARGRSARWTTCSPPDAERPERKHPVRTFKLQVQTSVDGYMAGPNGEMDWLTFPWTDDIGTYIDAHHEAGRHDRAGPQARRGVHPRLGGRPEGETQESIDWMNNTPKVVISNSLTESPWDNAVVAGGDLAETVNELKAKPGGDLIAYGGGTLVSNLIAEGLLDELHLFVNPTALGAGMPVFPSATPISGSGS